MSESTMGQVKKESESTMNQVSAIEDVMIGFERNGIKLTICNRFKKNVPVLTVHFDGEEDEYVMACFKTNEGAKWFAEVLEEFMSERRGR